ncbi:MAG: type II toxin-antitoxin system mRNA interferase toxin, RelE/StbE family [Ignavibacteriales bacterium CG18_big_fil_WC_8_21_14_2_50_31_20]|nr:MAG: type II toxin-antitoxin system mRNA interferase toxin, RelE/StbE family [Ignavibacteriales bacterium CG18_big_fil_WC_8_21_14_2_50_31_20]
MYNLSIERSAEKNLRKLSSVYFTKIITKIQELSNEPHPKGCKKLINNENFWRIRVGDYRVIYEVIEVESIIKIYKIGHRKDVYR